MTEQINFANEYAPAPESTDHIDIKDRYSLFINGEFTESESGKYFSTINPATEETIAEVADANKIDIDKAVLSARNAYNKTWKNSQRRRKDGKSYIILQKKLSNRRLG